MRNSVMVLGISAACIALSAPVSAAAATDAVFAREAREIQTTVLREARSAAAARDAFRGPDQALLRDQTTMVHVALNAKTVKCSRADYSEPQLKILIPALAELTVLNHRNTSEGAPCVAAGPCGTLNPADILKPGEGTENIPVRVVLKKVAALDGGICRVSLVETIKTEIRGVPFFHEESHAVAERVADDCR